MQTSRRDLLIGSALAALRPLTGATTPAIRFPTAPRDRLAMASYSLRSVLDVPRNRARGASLTLIPLRDLPALVKDRFGLQNLELLGQHFPSTDPPYLRDLLAAVKAAGSRVINLPTSVGASFYDPDPAKRTLAITNSKKWIDTALAIECPSVRLHIQKVDGAAPSATLAAAALREVAEYGASKSIVINLENDDPASEDAFFIAQIIDAVASPWLRALPDFCNSMLKGDEKFNYDAVKALFARAYNISHAKDSEVDGQKIVRVDLARTFGIAREARYKGWFSVEWEGAGEVWGETSKLVEQCLKLV
ncbi:MAG TPA: TIM barrel protein [Bryobacteraceae bacterium]|nr:TIM barrel protein [Bryobacteraceae bacterium]